MKGLGVGVNVTIRYWLFAIRQPGYCSLYTIHFINYLRPTQNTALCPQVNLGPKHAVFEVLLRVGVILISAVAFTLLQHRGRENTGLYGIPMYQLENMLQDVKNPLTLQLLKGDPDRQHDRYVHRSGLGVGVSVSRRSEGIPAVAQARSGKEPVVGGLGMLTAVAAHQPAGRFEQQDAFAFFLAPVEQWMRDSEDKAAVLTEAFLDMPDPGALLFNLFRMIALLPAIGESGFPRCSTAIVQRMVGEEASRHLGGGL